MTQKVLKVGNSFGVTLPKDFVVENQVKSGVDVDVLRSGHSITYSLKIPKATKYEEIPDKEFVRLAKKVESLYGPALDKLAKLP